MEQRTRREAELEVEEIKMFMASLGASGTDGVRIEYIRGPVHFARFGAGAGGAKTEMVGMCTEDGR